MKYRKETSEESRRKGFKQRFAEMPPAKKASVLLLCAGIILLLYYAFANYLPKLYRILEYKNSLDIITVDDIAVKPDDTQTDYASYTYPTDKLFRTTQRENYKDGDMVLKVPRLNYEGAVLNGTSNSVLKKGVGLYYYSAMPSYGNPNVAIAGHRGVYGAEFYMLDKMQQGDIAYLYYDNHEFTYQYVSTQVITLDNWQPIYCTDESTLTLTTCTFENTTDRVVVKCKLIAVRELTPNDDYYSADAAESSESEI